LVVTREGMPLGYEVFDGNRTDVTTVEHVVATMEKRFGVANRIWVMDRGMTSEKNIAWLRSEKRRDLIGTPKSEIKKWKTEIIDASDWKTVREGIEAKICCGPDGEETFVLCRSDPRRVKEHAMHDRFRLRIEQSLERLAKRLKSQKKRAERAVVERQIGRLFQRNSRASARYDVQLVEDITVSSRLRVTWTARPEWDEWAHYSEGCYVLRTNVNDWSPEELWKTYTQLNEADWSFAPNWQV